MTRLPILRVTLGVVLALAVLATPGTAQRTVQRVTTPPTPITKTPITKAPINKTTFTPRFEVIAETPLLMEGLLHSNYLSLHRLLKSKPTDRESWVFARGQAILIAEGGNLLLLRPAKGTGRDPWMKMATDMRSRATTLARVVAAKDHAKSVQALANLSTSCKQCHQTFRIPAKIDPPPEASPTSPLPPEADTE